MMKKDNTIETEFFKLGEFVEERIEEIKKEQSLDSINKSKETDNIQEFAKRLGEAIMNSMVEEFKEQDGDD